MKALLDKTPYMPLSEPLTDDGNLKEKRFI
jgi:hypothetical protein